MPAENKISSERRAIRLAGTAIVLGGLAAYAGSFSGAMLYDDLPSIVDNPAIRHLWPWAVSAVASAGGLTVSGRPFLQFSLAANYALGGDRVWGYHAANLTIHLAAGLVLFGLIRRTLDRWRGSDATWAAGGAALLWTLHPLQTESVTYLVQRAESLMGLCYLLTLYAFIRGTAEEVPSFRWLGLSWLACLFGMATKEVMVTAPLMVLLYDRTFVAGTFREAWRRRGWYYPGVALTWLPLAALVLSTGGNRGGTAGFGVAVSGWAYALTQFQAVTHYLRLSLWPHPLVFDYGTYLVQSPVAVLGWALPLLPLLALTLWALRRAEGEIRGAGFLGAWFFGILAPTSLTPSTKQMIVEHRMYLPLAAVMVAAVLGLRRVRLPRPATGVLLLAAAAVLGSLTFLRNETYASPLAIWGDTAAKRPDNAVAVYNLGVAFDRDRQFAAAVARFSRVTQLRPDLAEPYYDWGLALFQLGRPAEAEARFESALQIDPQSALAHDGLGIALAGLGRPAEAMAHYEEAIRLDPGFARAHDNLGNALLQLQRWPEAAAQYGEAVRLDPGSMVAHYNLANVLMRLGHPGEAAEHYEAVLRVRPDDPAVRAALERAHRAAGGTYLP